ncbi:hypothetical protein HPB48_014063 [Haemaphysalis longicornis]|uniref:C2H2-type domain-containing protein n=1 Tax=Haemaphysalis longicornis TaxID=44386 RepID=A0A9J6FP78_HAELO|nr:hypothetical protein HPB48_014063 [Haemaphysalis longicornis]
MWHQSEDQLDVADGEEEDDEEESLTCNVCERSFASKQRLSRHQQRKGHFGCPVCDALFPSFLALEDHRESLEHWSDDEEYEALRRSSAPGMRQPQRGRGCGGDDFYNGADLDDEDEETSSEDETESDSDGAELDSDSEDLERLL